MFSTTYEPGGPIRTVFVHVMGANFSGAGKNLFRLLRRIDCSKVKPILVGQTENELTRRARALGMDVLIVPYPPAIDVYGGKLLNLGLWDVFRVCRGVWKYNVSLKRRFAKVQPRVVWADNIRTLLFVYPVSKLCGCRIIWNIWSEPKGKTAWVLHRVGLLLADVINLEYARQAEKVFGGLAKLGFARKRMVTLYTGVTDFEELSGSNVRGELNLSAGDIVLLMAANISAAKGQVDLITAVGRLVERFPNVHLLLAGTPNETHPEAVAYDAGLKRYVEEKQLGGNVHFLGWRTDIPDVLRAADVYVSTSYSESFPDAVREAMRAGRAIVVSNVGGTSELVREGDSGFLIEPGDVDSLVAYLSTLILEPELRASMGAVGKRIIEESFSTEAYVRRFEDMVLDLCH